MGKSGHIFSEFSPDSDPISNPKYFVIHEMWVHNPKRVRSFFRLQVYESSPYSKILQLNNHTNFLRFFYKLQSLGKMVLDSSTHLRSILKHIIGGKFSDINDFSLYLQNYKFFFRALNQLLYIIRGF